MLKSEMEIINFRNFPYFSKRNETEKLNFWEKNFYFPSLKHRKKKKFPDGNFCSVVLVTKNPFFSGRKFPFRKDGIPYFRYNQFFVEYLMKINNISDLFNSR